jgi:ABC-2 type transport system permease protein
LTWRITWAIARKEILHIFRDNQTWLLVVLSPAVLLIMFAYLFAFDVSHFTGALIDQDHSASSRQYIRALTSDKVVELSYAPQNVAALGDLMLRGAVDVGLVIPPGFERELLAQHDVRVQLILDGSDPNTATRALAEVSSRTSSYSAAVVLAARDSAGGLLDVRSRIWYNPALKSLISMIPGLIAVVMIMPAFNAAQALAREKELGTLESLLSTPVRRLEIIVGKGIPYLLSGMGGVIMSAGVAVLWFRVPFRGSFALFLLLGLDFLFASCFMALALANFVESQQAAMIGMFILFFLPGFFLSGLIHPLASGGLAARIEGALLPGTYLVTISRSLFLKGVGLRYIWEPALGLAVLGLCALTLAVLTFRNRLA